MIPPTPFAEQVRIHVYGILFAFYRLILYLFFLS
jgi:hypothetical protein